MWQNVGTMRFNWLQPPFDNVKMRQAVLQAANRSDYMAAMAGDPENWRTCYSVYACLGAEETRGSDALSGPRDYDKAKRLVAEAGYKGEPVVLLTVTRSLPLQKRSAERDQMLQVFHSLVLGGQSARGRFIAGGGVWPKLPG